ncbi:hypothetical protein HPP92_019560 [Vanilla planifolia]|uniref:Uncharacterized protein n=1 Tax=Vanilla planifolia TaxID=51239 RepID=A0A835Q7K2_VANPL|nr:hypothetical protein HPP92_019992 [Vanilla planifolia]KAG0465396.1 hypothetical protein HPP92_019560 [Vanilla planifolia]
MPWLPSTAAWVPETCFMSIYCFCSPEEEISSFNISFAPRRFNLKAEEHGEILNCLCRWRLSARQRRVGQPCRRKGKEHQGRRKAWTMSTRVPSSTWSSPSRPTAKS